MESWQTNIFLFSLSFEVHPQNAYVSIVNAKTNSALVRNHKFIFTNGCSFSKVHRFLIVEAITVGWFHGVTGDVLFVRGIVVLVVVFQSFLVSANGIAMMLRFQLTFCDDGSTFEQGLAVDISQRNLKKNNHEHVN